MVNATMNQTLDSGSAQVGQRFTMTVVAPYPRSDQSFSGASLSGHVTTVTPAGQGKNAELAFAIDRISLTDGAAGHPILAVQSQQTQQHNNTANVAATALAGMLVGNWLGKAVFNSNAGGAVGAVAGALYASNKRTNVSLRQGAEVVFQAQQTVALR
jgi:predicted RecA/RadA family phage recombinase